MFLQIVDCLCSEKDCFFLFYSVLQKMFFLIDGVFMKFLVPWSNFSRISESLFPIVSEVLKNGFSNPNFCCNVHVLNFSSEMEGWYNSGVAISRLWDRSTPAGSHRPSSCAVLHRGGSCGGWGWRGWGILFAPCYLLTITSNFLPTNYIL